MKCILCKQCAHVVEIDFNDNNILSDLIIRGYIKWAVIVWSKVIKIICFLND